MTRRNFLKASITLVGLAWIYPEPLFSSLIPPPATGSFDLPLGGDPLHRADWPYAPQGLDPFEALRFRLIYHGLPERERAKELAAERR